MENLMVFENPEFGQVRTVLQDNRPLFVAKDVCMAFGDTDHKRSISRLDDDEKCFVTVKDSMGRDQIVTAVNEAGLYILLFGFRPHTASRDGGANLPPHLQNRMEKLHSFKRWIAHDVLPSINSRGIYATDDTIERLLNDPDFAISLLTTIKEERQKCAALEEQITEDQPYTEFARSIAGSSDSIYVGDFAKLVCNSGINIGRTRLFKWLRENEYLMDDNKPYQRYIDQGLFAVKENCIRTIRGEMIKFTTLITGKGQMVLLGTLQREFGLEKTNDGCIAVS